MLLLSQSCWFDMFACRVACGLAWPPGAATEQDVHLATAVTTHLTSTIAAQLNQTATAGQRFHVKKETGRSQNFDYSHGLAMANIAEWA